MTEYMVKSRFHGDGKIVAAYLNDAGKVIVDILFLNSKALQQRVHPIATFPLFQAVSYAVPSVRRPHRPAMDCPADSGRRVGLFGVKTAVKKAGRLSSPSPARI